MILRFAFGVGAAFHFPDGDGVGRVRARFHVAGARLACCDSERTKAGRVGVMRTARHRSAETHQPEQASRPPPRRQTTTRKSPAALL